MALLHGFLLAVLASVFSLERAGAYITSSTDYAPATASVRHSVHALSCSVYEHVYILEIAITYANVSCCGNECYTLLTPGDFATHVKSCADVSRCNVSVAELVHKCGQADYRPQSAHVSYVCLPAFTASATIAIEDQTSTSGDVTAGRLSTPGLQSRDHTWVCVVEAMDCSRRNVSVELAIANAASTSSYFSMTEVGRLGQRFIQSKDVVAWTPFDVELHLVNGSDLRAAYVAFSASWSLSLACGRPVSNLTSFRCGLTTADETSTTADQRSTTADQRSTTVDQRSTTVDQRSTTVDQRSTTVDQRSTTVDQRSVPAEQQTEPSFLTPSAWAAMGALVLVLLLVVVLVLIWRRRALADEAKTALQSKEISVQESNASEMMGVENLGADLQESESSDVTTGPSSQSCYVNVTQPSDVDQACQSHDAASRRHVSFGAPHACLKTSTIPESDERDA